MMEKAMNLILKYYSLIQFLLSAIILILFAIEGTITFCFTLFALETIYYYYGALIFTYDNVFRNILLIAFFSIVLRKIVSYFRGNIEAQYFNQN